MKYSYVKTLRHGIRYSLKEKVKEGRKERRKTSAVVRNKTVMFLNMSV
jgi:hypothetical protein